MTTFFRDGRFAFVPGVLDNFLRVRDFLLTKLKKGSYSVFGLDAAPVFRRTTYGDCPLMCKFARSGTYRFAILGLELGFLCLLLLQGLWAQRGSTQTGPTGVIVHSQFGGQIFGFDIDQNGTEGVLTEAKTGSGGKVLAAIETFDQASGKILKVVKKTTTMDDFLTLGVVGNSVGLIEHEHVQGILNVIRTFGTINPLSSNMLTGKWTPPLQKTDLISAVSRNQGASNSAVLAFHNTAAETRFVFSSNVAGNTFGPRVQLTDPTFTSNPQLAYDPIHNVAVVAASDGAVGGPAPQIALVNLTTGQVTQFTGILGPPPFHQGFINGLAVDAEDQIAVTTTEVDFSVEFYDLTTQTGFSVVLPGATGQLQSGSDVEYDPVNKLFFVAQSVSSTATGSSIQVYDIHGNLVESLNGFNFSSAFNVIGTHIALNPANRTGYVDGPDAGVTQVQQFSY